MGKFVIACLIHQTRSYDAQRGVGHLVPKAARSVPSLLLQDITHFPSLML